jgi:hypothetical protein
VLGRAGMGRFFPLVFHLIPHPCLITVEMFQLLFHPKVLFFPLGIFFVVGT